MCFCLNLRIWHILILCCVNCQINEWTSSSLPFWLKSTLLSLASQTKDYTSFYIVLFSSKQKFFFQLETVLVLFIKKLSWCPKMSRASYGVYIYINTHSPLFSTGLSVCQCFSHPPTKPLRFTPSMEVCDSLVFRGQERDVHPQLLVSQRQDARIAFGQSAPDLHHSLGHSLLTGSTHMIRWMPWFSVNSRFNSTNIKVWMVVHPFIMTSTCFSWVS